MLRIIAGRFKGRRIVSPKGVSVRPTADRVKEALFQMIDIPLEGASVLDLCAGSGNLGLEALSRGASSCCFVDRSAHCCRAIRKNCERLGLRGGVDARRLDCIRAIRLFHGSGERFSLVLADPPYWKSKNRQSVSKKVLCALDSYASFTLPALVVLEHSKEDLIPAGLTRLTLHKQRKYGETMLSFFAVKK